jgi:hypothetical protein
MRVCTLQEKKGQEGAAAGGRAIDRRLRRLLLPLPSSKAFLRRQSGGSQSMAARGRTARPGPRTLAAMLNAAVGG